MLLLARGQWLDGLSIQFLYSAAFVRFIYLNIGFQSLSALHHVANKEDKRLESSYSGRTVVLF